MRALPAFAVLVLAGCQFTVGPVGAGGGDDLSAGDFAMVDLAGADLAGADLSADAGADLAQPADLSQPADLTVPPDLTTPPDLVTPPDLTTPPDLITVFQVPSHVGHHYLDDSATDWTITNDTTVDTSLSTNAISPAPPAGVVYAIDGPYAVIAVHSLTVGNGGGSTTRLNVIGSRPLIIVAGTTITVNGLIDAGGHGSAPGPGGGAPGAAAVGAPANGVGGSGAISASGEANGTGGGGAGYGLDGAQGGDALESSGNTAGGPAAGTAYGTSMLASLWGGSGGGTGNAPSGSSASCVGGGAAPGGAGGGALQLSARTSIAVANTHNFLYGIINTGGGGGSGGCGGITISGAGGGGGSGGALLLEAVSVDVKGIIGASGGGGGGGGGLSGFPIASPNNGERGHDALDLMNVFNSSAGGNGNVNGNTGGKGGNTVVNTGGPSQGGMANGSLSSGGGGGGGFGRIFVRAHGAPSLGSASPAALVDTGLPAALP